MISFGEFATKQVEADLKQYCLKHWGKWWSTKFFMNKEAQSVYDTIRMCSMAVAIQVISKDDKDYQKYIDMHNDLTKEFSKDKENKVWLKK